MSAAMSADDHVVQPGVSGQARPAQAAATTGPGLTGLARTALILGAVIDLAIGLAFLFGPEVGLTLWPTPIAPVLMRFIGGIVIANGAGAWLAARGGTWEGARVLFAVALVYGAIVLVALLYHLLPRNAPPVFWIYAIVDALFLGPIGYIYWTNERADREHRG